MSLWSSDILRACSVYCHGDLLHNVQVSGLYNDSKTFVDMPMKINPEEILAAYDELGKPTDPVQLQGFLNEYFYEAGSDLEEYIPVDYTANPEILSRITDPSYRGWASSLNDLWKTLGRKVDQSVVENPQRHSYLVRSHPMIVPGGRFRESYYWDTWWILRGLLVCDMYETAMDVMNNLMDDVKTFGFVPNGGRIYYLDRSQPPVLSEMVMNYYEYMSRKGNLLSSSVQDFLLNALDTLQEEYSWWMNDQNQHTFTTSDGSVLNHYNSEDATPRPESYLEDYNTFLGSGREGSDIYTSIRAGAESGWDFSSRWIKFSKTPNSEGTCQDNQTTFSNDVFNLTNIYTKQIIPVELNTIMYRFEKNIARLASILGELSSESSSQTGSASDTIFQKISENFTIAAESRYNAIQKYLWDSSTYQWRDLNLTSGFWTSDCQSDNSIATTNPFPSISNFIPLWAGIVPEGSAENILNSLQLSGLIQDPGVLTTSMQSGQQWDLPNSWPPLVLFTIEGLQTLNISSSLELADQVTKNWLETCYRAFVNTGFMYEKYNAFEVGIGGGGGEYVPQIGFGWSNAVIFVLLDQLYPAVSDTTTYTSISTANGSSSLSYILLITFLTVFGVTIIFICSFFYYDIFGKEKSDNEQNNTFLDNGANNNTNSVI